MDSLASIIVPCYNGEKFVDRCFDSILKQKYAHMEVIVMDQLIRANNAYSHGMTDSETQEYSSFTFLKRTKVPGERLILD